MKTIKLAVASVLLSTSFISGPAFAGLDDDIPLPPINGELGDSPQDICDEQLKPNENSGFLTEPLNEVTGDWEDDGAPIRGDNVGDPVPTGTPVASNVILSNSYFRNGGSPNVWALAQATLTYPNSTQEYETTQHQLRTTSFDCHVWKYVGGDNQNLVEPPGLQSTGNTTVEERTIDGPNGFDTNNGPITLVGQTVHALICISPNNVTKGKPGTWTGKNGFLAANCPNASIEAGGTVPSGNAPDI